jgi:hypothetical protein
VRLVRNSKENLLIYLRHTQPNLIKCHLGIYIPGAGLVLRFRSSIISTPFCV